MYSTDKGNFKRFLNRFSDQILESKTIFKKSAININSKKVDKILYLGMGGSAIAGDVLNDVLFNYLTIPMHVVRGYEVPGYCDNRCLVIASSYSGDTEETINAVQKASKTSGQIIAVTSGGKLLDLAQKNGWGVIKIPQGFPPRQAFGYLFFPVLLMLNKFSKKTVTERKINDIYRFIKMLIQRHDEESAEGKILCRELAVKLRYKIPIIYSSEPYFKAVATRWRTQFQENSKSMAFCNVIPEMNHNEIVGWEMANKILTNFVVIFLENDSHPTRIKTRIQLTKNIIRDKGIEVVEIYSHGETLLENVISLICIGDWVSYYLALLYEKNPAAIINIDYLKSELKKMA